jgi:hypothetical protein
MKRDENLVRFVAEKALGWSESEAIFNGAGELIELRFLPLRYDAVGVINPLSNMNDALRLLGGRLEAKMRISPGDCYVEVHPEETRPGIVNPNNTATAYGHELDGEGHQGARALTLAVARYHGWPD